MSLSTKSGKHAVQSWAEEIGKEYGIEVRDLTYSFEDGLLLCAIIHYYEPLMLDFDALDLENASENLNMAFDVAVEKLVIDTDLEAADINPQDSKKMKELYKFICQLFKLFNPDHSILKKKKKVGKKKSIKKKKSLKKKKIERKKIVEKVEEKIVEEKIVEEKIVEETPKEIKDGELCEECEEGVAVKYCSKCDSKQCLECSTHLHKLKKRRNHPVISLEEYYESEPKKEEEKVEKDDGRGRCDKHNEMKLVAYCKTCDEPICTTCMLKTHDGHEKQDLEGAKPENLKEYSNLLDEMKSSLENYQSFRTLLDKNEGRTSDSIKSFFKNVRDELSKKEEFLLGNLDDFHKSNTEKLTNDIKGKNVLINLMENEEKFVEQLKLKIKAKSAIKEMNENSTSLYCDGYCFQENDRIVEYIEKFLIVIENLNKLSLKKIKNGSQPSDTVTTKIDPLVKEKKEEKTEEIKKEETETQEEKEVVEEKKEEIEEKPEIQEEQEDLKEEMEIVDEGEDTNSESEEKEEI